MMRPVDFQSDKGYSLIELAMVIIAIAVLASVGMMSTRGIDEERDAAMVQSVQASLQAIVNQGAARMDMRPADFQSADFQKVLSAARSSLGLASGTGIQLTGAGRNFTLSINQSNRKATYTVDTTGNVLVQGLTHFDHYQVADNTIRKGG